MFLRSLCAGEYRSGSSWPRARSTRREDFSRKPAISLNRRIFSVRSSSTFSGSFLESLDSG